MSWGDNWLYPDRADKNDDGRVDSWEQSEADYEYDAVMGTNISGGFPERDRSNLSFDDDEDFFDDEYDKDEKAERYADELHFDPITEVDNNGYWNDEGEYHLWKIKDFVNDYDENGYWDKCGDYHDFEENPKEGYWLGGLYTPFRKDYNCYYDKTNRKYLLKAEGFWMDNICYIEGINGQYFIGAVMNQKFYSYNLYGDWKKYHDYVNDRELNYQVSMDKKTHVDTNFAKRADHFPCYEGVIGYWDWDDEILYIYEEGNLEKIIGYVEDRKFHPYNCSEEKVSAITTSDQDDKSCKPDKNNLLSDIEPFFSEPQKDIEPEICFSKTATGKIYASVYENFKEIRNFVSPKEFENDYRSFVKIYSKNRVLGAECWSWIIENYRKELISNPRYEILRCNLFMYIPSDFFIRDNEDRNKFFQHYIAERPELMDVLFSKFIYIDINDALFQFLGWSIVRNDLASFEKAYHMILKNRNYMSSQAKKEYVLEQALIWRNKFARSPSSEKFFIFFKDEIATIESVGKKQHLNDMLNQNINGEDVFMKPKNYKNIDEISPKITVNFVPTQVPKESENITSKSAETTIYSSELNELLEHKRMLETMLKEVEDKIAELSAPAFQHKTTPEEENDKFFDDAGVAGITYGNRDAVMNISIDQKLLLIREPDNRYDKSAVTVYDASNRKIGYISRQTNVSVARGMDSGLSLYAKASSVPQYDRYPNMKIEVWKKSK